MKKLVLIGGGNQASYTIDIIEKENKYKIVGIIDSIHDIGSDRFGYKIIGRQENLRELIKKYSIDVGVISIGDNWLRSCVWSKIIEQVPNFEFVNAIHPSVVIGNNVEVGVGVVAMAGCIFNPNAVIEDFTFFATGAKVEHDCHIGKFASISGGSTLGGYVDVGKFSAITLGVTVVDRIRIGEHSVVGSGSLVLKNVPDNVLVYGIPSKIIRERKPQDKFLK
jgi:sugar O-acyltransferase (sialic acid O-acetyltransferase NeuD family)